MSETINDDMLKTVFALQEELNNYVFETQDLRDNDGERLAMATIRRQVDDGHLMVNDLPNQWLCKYVKAMQEELGELQEELLWKWWSKDKIDLQNLRVELVDILHFLVSAMICAGFTPEKLFDVYKQKHAVNVERQDSGYSRESKKESDNRQIN
jgi:hypothetical protein